MENGALQRTIGERIRKRRTELELSLRGLAEKTRVSASFLSQVERGQVSPSLSTLQAIAEALQVPLVYFLMGSSSDEHVVQAGQGAQLELPGSKIVYELRSPSPPRKMLVFVAHMQPDTVNKAIPPQMNTQETVYILQGRLIVELEDERYTLDPGDSITFNGQQLVCLINDHPSEVSYISFITPPPFQ